MNWSLALAAILLVVKVIAAVATGSSAIYSDAAESVTHVLAVGFAAWALRYSYKPSDEDHQYGHDKIGFISATVEGASIIAAAALIGYQAVQQMVHGVHLASLGLGMWLVALVAVVNLILGLALIRVGKSTRSMLLQANGEHVLTDVWTTVGVLLALLLVKFTAWVWWDPLVAVLISLKLFFSGAKLIKGSLGGLMDATDAEVDRELCAVLDKACESRGLSYHNLRHRHSGRIHWAELHLVFPDEMTVRDAHHLATEVEAEVAKELKPEGRVISHLEPRSAEHLQEHWEER